MAVSKVSFGTAVREPYRVPVLGEIISIMDEEVSAVDMDESTQAQVLGPVALLPRQLLASPGHMEVLQPHAIT